FRPIIERWNGRRWKVAATPSSATGVLRAVAASSGRDVWAVGDSSSPDPLIEHFDGTRWSVVTASVGETANSYLSGITVLSPTAAWAVGGTAIPLLPGGGGWTNPRKPLTMHWDGQSWSTVAAPPSRAPLDAVAATSPNDVWAVGEVDIDSETLPTRV